MLDIWPPPQVKPPLDAYTERAQEMLETLFPSVYGELTRIAHKQLKSERPGHTLDTVALVHESYCRLARQSPSQAYDRSHFLALASHVMRNILVDHARQKLSAKRGGEQLRITLTDAAAVVPGPDLDILALQQAIEQLRHHDARLERVAECKIFGGMATAEIAAAVNVSARTVEKDWTIAKAYLHRALQPEGGSAGS
ncbi:ECF-type sigma factor [Luteimonas salinilitoris]|uniref:ECF-type sigma factor n=1 Tax=Luteimonas salinilitoris TaxID=3237697 RepID=A0ABV4HPH8_9GAMM